ncbi:hypothetical protein [Ktedonobacter sp. SOSP1-52]|uniref:hypothetical protein n=1 Tax=Ktedonobacter sp. SOSP1-52 TaxID=2778366 RepID=UPI001916151C|nr:hypothetical protein [Ktedonobacter sp. SOSP1-52]
MSSLSFFRAFHRRPLEAAQGQAVWFSKSARASASPRAIASHFGNWLYRLHHNKAAFKTLLCKCVLRAD